MSQAHVFSGSEHYVTLKEVRNAFIQILKSVPSILNEADLRETASSLAITVANHWAPRREVRKDAKPFKLLDTLSDLEKGLSIGAFVQPLCFKLMQENPQTIVLSSEILLDKILALTDLIETYPQITIPQKAQSIKNRTDAFKELCGSEASYALGETLDYIRNLRRYVEVVDRGYIRHEPYNIDGATLSTVFRIPPPVLSQRLAKADAYRTRTLQISPQSKKKTTARDKKISRSPTAISISVPSRPKDQNNKSKEGQQTIAAKMLAMRAPKKNL